MTESSSAPTKSASNKKPAGGGNKPTRRPATGARKARSLPELSALRDWCASLNFAVRPTVHVNGPQFHACVLTVDFGTPLVQERLDQDQQNELGALMVRATADVIGREGGIGVSNDLREGVWYTTTRG